MKNGLNPWADAMLSQLLICRLAVSVSLKTCAPQTWGLVGAVPDKEMPRRGPRLNPMEFHGRRSPNSMSHSDSASAADAPGARRSNRAHVPR